MPWWVNDLKGIDEDLMLKMAATLFCPLCGESDVADVMSISKHNNFLLSL
jgi:hypothetical protein